MSRTLERGPGFVRAVECPECRHTKCGPTCTCPCQRWTAVADLFGEAAANLYGLSFSPAYHDRHGWFVGKHRGKWRVIAPAGPVTRVCGRDRAPGLAWWRSQWAAMRAAEKLRIEWARDLPPFPYFTVPED
jgi:hypothetical protein